MKKTIITVSIAFAASGMALGVMAAESYPEDDIEFIVPYGAGGGSDSLVRALQPGMEESFDGTIYVRNISGGGGAVGYGRAVNAEPDGYTLTTPNNATFTLEGLGNVDFKYKDFEYIARVLVEPYVLAVGEDADWQNFDEMKESLENGESISVGFSGVGSSTHVTTVAVADELGVDFNLIPFDGGSDAVSAAMGGHVDAVLLNPSDLMSAVDSGRLSPVFSTSEGRSEAFPDAPSLSELGYDFVLDQWRGVAAPKGISQSVEDKIVEAVENAIKGEEFNNFAKQSGAEVSPLYGDDLDTYVESIAEVMIPIAESVKE